LFKNAHFIKIRFMIDLLYWNLVMVIGPLFQLPSDLYKGTCTIEFLKNLILHLHFMSNGVFVLALSIDKFLD